MADEPTVTLTLPPFPTLTRDTYSWEGRAKLPAWAGFQSRQAAYAGRDSKKGSDGTVRVDVSVKDNDPTRYTPSPEQCLAFQYLLDHQDDIRVVILRKLFRSYPSHRREYADDYSISDAAELEKRLPKLTTAGELNRVIGLSIVHLSKVSLGGMAYIGLEFGCNWEREHGLGVLLHKRRVAKIGHADVCFLEWVAEDDVEKQQAKKKG